MGPLSFEVVQSGCSILSIIRMPETLFENHFKSLINTKIASEASFVYFEWKKIEFSCLKSEGVIVDFWQMTLLMWFSNTVLQGRGEKLSVYYISFIFSS